MIEPPPQPASASSHRWASAVWLAEVLLILVVFFVVGGEPPPHDNEAHYLCRLKHFWNPQWCPGDLFLESADAQLLFIWTFGWVTRWLSLPATAWVGRVVAWTLLAWAWQRLSWRLVPRPLAAVLSAALFVTLNGLAHLAGEWIVGGVEAKCFAYVFVVLALRELVDDLWNRVWLLLGAAAAFHPLVGGWSAVVCGGVWLSSNVAALQIANLKTARAMLPGLLGGGLIALLGVVPAMQLTWNESPDVVAQAGRIYVFDRLPHHLALLTLPSAEVFQRVSRHAALLLTLWLLSRATSTNSKFAICNQPPWPINFRGLHLIVRFAWGAALLAAMGFVLELVFWNEPLAAARWLRYYWFRLTDFAAPLAVAMVAAAILAAGLQRRRTWAACGLAAAIALTGGHLAGKAMQRLTDAVPPADRKMRDFAAWTDVCQWIAGHTESDALFLTPRLNQSFKWRTGRAEVVTRKDIPQDARHIVEWFRRYRIIYYQGTSGGETDEPAASLGHLGTERVRQLAAEFGARYVVTDWQKPLWLPVVYPNVQYANGEYVVYRIPERSPPIRSTGDGE
ncbi:MAG: DUF6798 domain-containing protein [Pirellulales bacterium]